MRTEQRMDEDYDYHMNTGELPEYFGGNNGSSCLTLIAIVLFVIVCIWGCVSKCSSDRKQEKQKSETKTVPASEYLPSVATPYFPPAKDSDSIMKEHNNVRKPSAPYVESEAYEEGYEDGMAAAEEDRLAGRPGMQIGDEGDDDDYDEGYDDGYYDGFE